MIARRRIATVFLLAGIFVALLWLDGPIAGFFHDHVGDDHSPRVVTTVLRLPGDFFFAAGCAILLVVFRNISVPDTLLLILTGLPGSINGVIKGVAGRARPYTMDGRWHLFRGGWYGFWHQHDVSFTSGDATQAFAWAEAMSLIFPGGRAFFYAWAAVTGLQRVVMTAHWPSDVFAGAVLGVVTVRVVFSYPLRSIA